MDNTTALLRPMRKTGWADACLTWVRLPDSVYSWMPVITASTIARYTVTKYLQPERSDATMTRESLVEATALSVASLVCANPSLIRNWAYSSMHILHLHPHLSFQQLALM